jgi:hypothetical protein
MVLRTQRSTMGAGLGLQQHAGRATRDFEAAVVSPTRALASSPRKFTALLLRCCAQTYPESYPHTHAARLLWTATLHKPKQTPSSHSTLCPALTPGYTLTLLPLFALHILIYLSTNLPIYLTIYPSIHLPVYPLYIYLSLSIDRSISHLPSSCSLLSKP